MMANVDLSVTAFSSISMSTNFSTSEAELPTASGSQLVVIALLCDYLLNHWVYLTQNSLALITSPSRIDLGLCEGVGPGWMCWSNMRNHLLVNTYKSGDGQTPCTRT